MVNIIPTRITVRKRKQIRTKLPHTLRNSNYVNIIKQEPIKSKLIPQSFVVNARSIVKPDTCPALYAELNSIITSTFVVFPKHGYTNYIQLPNLIYRISYYKERQNIENKQNMDNPFECLWGRITTQNVFM